MGKVRFSAQESLAAAFLVGRQPPKPVSEPGVESLQFVSGGFYVVRNRENGFFFMADMGEVGMRGLGGHGHNDLFSFELFINGEPVVVDPTGDTPRLEARRPSLVLTPFCCCGAAAARAGRRRN